MQELFKYPDFKGITLAFVERKPERLKVVKGIAEKINNAYKWEINFEGYSDRREALQALLIDPYIASVKKAEALLADVLDYNKQYEIRF